MFTQKSVRKHKGIYSTRRQKRTLPSTRLVVVSRKYHGGWLSTSLHRLFTRSVFGGGHHSALHYLSSTNQFELALKHELAFYCALDADYNRYQRFSIFNKNARTNTKIPYISYCAGSINYKPRSHDWRNPHDVIQYALNQLGYSKTCKFILMSQTFNNSFIVNSHYVLLLVLTKVSSTKKVYVIDCNNKRKQSIYDDIQKQKSVIEEMVRKMNTRIQIINYELDEAQQKLVSNNVSIGIIFWVINQISQQFTSRNDIENTIQVVLNSINARNLQQLQIFFTQNSIKNRLGSQHSERHLSGGNSKEKTAAEAIQRIARRRAAKRNETAVKLQAQVRKQNQKNTYQNQRDAAIKLQKAYRKHLDRDGSVLFCRRVE